MAATDKSLIIVSFLIERVKKYEKVTDKKSYNALVVAYTIESL